MMNAMYFPVLESAAPFASTDQTALRRAVELNQFQPFFQPIVNADGRWVGAEILMRWNHPEHGVLPPSAFLESLEGNGLLVTATRRMLSTAIAHWQRHVAGFGRPFFLSFNACLAHLENGRLADDCRQALAQLHTPDLHLVLEMPERGADLGVEGCQTLFSQLEHAGISVAIDDFGIGDARMHQFACGNIHCVKIDRSFVSDITSSALYRRLVACMVAFASAFGARVTAEGVETLAQHRCLEQLGVNLFQGYLFARPMNAQQFFDRLAAVR